MTPPHCCGYLGSCANGHGGAWGEESTGPLNLPLSRRGKGHQAKGVNSARQSPGRNGGPAPSEEEVGRRFFPTPGKLIVKNVKLDFNKTIRRGYVQNGGGLSPKSTRQGLCKGSLSPRSALQLTFPRGELPSHFVGKGAPAHKPGGLGVTLAH